MEEHDEEDTDDTKTYNFPIQIHSCIPIESEVHFGGFGIAISNKGHKNMFNVLT